MTAVTKIVLVDDHMLFREGLKRLLDAESGVQVVGDFAAAAPALAALRAGLLFDVALVDYELAVPGGETTNGLDLLRQMRALRPDAKVLFVTAGMVQADLVTALEQMQAGIFLKSEPIAELLLAIQRTARGERWVSSGAALELLAVRSQSTKLQRGRQDLTERERTVLRGVLEGLSNKEIGARLELTESSVKAVLQRLFEKSGVRSRSQLVRYAIEGQIGTE